jgi:radical SAM protein with 4Fe4S-binding SPASM domain
LGEAKSKPHKKLGKLAKVTKQDVVNLHLREIVENSRALATLRQRDLFKDACGDCQYKLTCSGCRGRAYEETGDMMATDSGCWLTTGVSYGSPTAI